MANRARKSQRVFKTAWFAKAAGKALISDAELCVAIRQVMLGQCDDLGGGVWKKRLGRNLFRSIIVAKGGSYWVYAFLFAKSKRANIEQDELKEFRFLADVYAGKSDLDIAAELRTGEIVEICHGD